MKNRLPARLLSRFRPAFIALGTVAFAAVLSLSGRADDVPPANPYLHTVAADGTVRFELNELTKYAHFWWPRTLLNYHVVLNGPSAPPASWTLADEATGQPVPVQVSDVREENQKVVSATVSFFSDLPTGGHRGFVLHTAPSGAATPPDVALPAQDNSGFVLDTGALQIRVPGSQDVAAGKAAPGPIVAVNDGSGWVGQSTIDSPKKSVQKITTEILDRGPLFQRARVTYDFAGGGRYTATIKAPKGYNFVEFTETFSGLAVEDHAIFHFIWTGLPLTLRRGTEPIDKPHVTPFRGEDPAFSGPPRTEDPADHFYYQLDYTSMDIEATASNFSNPATGQGIGLCVLDGSKWDDGEYSIWASSDTLAVKFRYRNNNLEWMLPLAGKSRQIGITAYKLQDPTVTQDLSQDWGTKDQKDWDTTNGEQITDPRNWPIFVNSRYGGMSLDVIKDWQLAYPDNARRITNASLPPDGEFAHFDKNLQTFTNSLWAPNEVSDPEANWFSPVSLRMYHRWVVPGFYEYRDQLSSEMRARITALMLFQGYLASRQELSPIQHMLRGHPNFMADWKYPLMAGAFLFPDHPLAHEWADQFEKFLELCGVFYVRPNVKEWDATGGRWTESLGVYNFAFLGPASSSNRLGIFFDGRDRMANPGMALHGGYLAGIASAPLKMGSKGAPLAVQPGTPLTPQAGFQRIYPPQGAHASRHAIPKVVETFADVLKNYAPVTAEHMLWVTRHPLAGPGKGKGGEEDEDANEKDPMSQGTDPDLHSAKYTGYGIVMRAAVNTPNEISVYLQQVDKGPNYRWGHGNDNGSGDIYYYAGGKSYTGHAGEEAGDAQHEDGTVTSNTAVSKDGVFRCIGMNVLSEPFYDLGSAQFAELVPQTGPGAYSWPAYKSRSVMLVGHDYIITYDAVNGPSRMSWNTIKGEDEIPTIIGIRGDSAHTTQSEVVHKQPTECVRYEPNPAGGDRMYLVSHRSDLSVASTPTSPVAEINGPESTDFIYQQRATFQSNEGGHVFSGRAGVIREFKDGHTELNLFHGDRIGTASLELATDNPALGVSAIFQNPSEVSGKYYSYDGGKLTVTLPGGIPPGAQLYVNGALLKGGTDNKNIVAQLPAGGGRWQLTASPAVPMAPEITRTIARADGATIYFKTVASATSYRIESSHDGGGTWTAAGTATTGEFTLGGVSAPGKVAVRVVALNGNTAGSPGMAYPVEVTGKPAGPAKGLRLLLAADQATASWGEVLGAKEYVLYRRKAGDTTWQEIHRGPERTYTDQLKGIVAPEADPGFESEALREPVVKPVIYEYAVTAVDGIGESEKSSISNTDPTTWRNWYPDTSLQFKRQSAYWLPPYVTPDQPPPPSYPQ